MQGTGGQHHVACETRDTGRPVASAGADLSRASAGCKHKQSVSLLPGDESDS